MRMNTLVLALVTAAVAWPIVAAERTAISLAETATNDSPVAETSVSDSPQAVKAAKERGAKLAAKDIKAGEQRILYFGKPWSGGKPLVDETTGYRVQIVGGCLASDQFDAEVQAYNKTMRDWHAKTKTAGPSQKQ